MEDDPRYSSGSCLNRTSKEESLDRLEGVIGEMSDSLYIGLKKLTLEQIRELRTLIGSYKA